jgi:hypothetical protein
MKLEDRLLGKMKTNRRVKGRQDRNRVDEHHQSTLCTCSKCNNEAHYFVKLIYLRKTVFKKRNVGRSELGNEM